MALGKHLRLLFFLFAVLAFVATPLAASARPARQAKIKLAYVSDVGGLNDKGFNASGLAGTQQAVQDFGLAEPVIIESKAATDYVKNLTIAAEQADLIACVGFSLADAVKEVAPKFPDKKFVIVDFAYDPPIANVQGAVFTEEQGSYLVGMVAAGMSKTGVIGFLGGMDVPIIDKFYAGYEAGARAVRPDIKLLSAFTGDWVNQGKGKEIAISMADQNADVIYTAAGAAGLGGLTAAAERGIWGIGVDQDQHGVAPEAVITSMVKKVGRPIYEAARDLVNGEFKSGTVVFSLANDGVELAPFYEHEEAVPADLKAKIEQAKQDIINGSIKVPTCSRLCPAPAGTPEAQPTPGS